MSLRQKVDRERIKNFFKKLSQRFRREGKIYLVGGTTLVFEQLRDQTVDIDVVIEVAPKYHGELIQAIRELKEDLSLNVEESSPGDFIPLPKGFQERHQFVERFGSIDLFHFDLYSTALSKIERGRTQDMEDVLELLQKNKIEWEQLEKYFREILPQMGRQSLKQDPIEFEENFRALEALWITVSK